jgi:GrpB-like predicted nucleotidyltransferase (UPF0157 family)
METVRFFYPTESFQRHVRSIFEQESQRIARLIPEAEIEHIGATAVPGSLTKGDVDILVRVGEQHFDAARKALMAHYTINQPENWTESFASFKDDRLGALPLGVQLVVTGSADDIFAQCRDTLIAQPQQLARLNALKSKFDGRAMEEYRAAKAQFFEQLLSRDHA